jgi:hypothetical protein
MQPAGPIFLSSQYDGVDHHLKGKRSAFLGRESVHVANFVQHWSDATPSPKGGYGQQSIWELRSDTDYLGPIELVYEFGDLTAANDASDTDIYPRYVRWLGFAAIDYIQPRYHSQLLQKITGDSLMMIYACRTSLENRRDSLIGEPGDRGADNATKQALRKDNGALSSYKVYVPLNTLIWANHTGTFLPYGKDIARGTITMELQTRPITSLVEHEAASGADTVTGVIKSIVLRMNKVDVTQSEQASIRKMVSTHNEKMDIKSHARLCTTQEHQDGIVVENVDTLQEVDIVCSRPTKEILLGWRLDADEPDGTFKASLDRFNFQKLDTIGFRGVNRPILDDVDAEWMRNGPHNALHAGNTSEFNIYGISHSLAPDADSDVVGYLNYNNISDKKFRFKTPTSAGAGKLSLIYQTQNTLMIDHSGLRMLQL